jgi:hypothetical protein
MKTYERGFGLSRLTIVQSKQPTDRPGDLANTAEQSQILFA